MTSRRTRPGSTASSWAVGLPARKFTWDTRRSRVIQCSPTLPVGHVSRARLPLGQVLRANRPASKNKKTARAFMRGSAPFSCSDIQENVDLRPA
jgi:hypothetical protein